MFSFRDEARSALARAKDELATSAAIRVKYAALELREALEAITYDRARAMQDEIPPEEYRTWQPRKLMQLLVEIDPSADKTSTLAVGREDRLGVPAPPERMQTLGTDVALSLGDLKKHYDALGSALHMPSLAQIERGAERNFAGLRKRCEAVVEIVESTLVDNSQRHFRKLRPTRQLSAVWKARAETNPVELRGSERKML